MLMVKTKGQNLGLGNLRQFTLSHRTICVKPVLRQSKAVTIHQKNLPVYHMVTWERHAARGGCRKVPAVFCGCPIATLIPATFIGRVVTPGEETTAAGTDTTGGFAKAT